MACKKVFNNVLGKKLGQKLELPEIVNVIVEQTVQWRKEDKDFPRREVKIGKLRKSRY